LATPTDDQIVAAIREELTEMGVPVADQVTASSQWSSLDIDSIEVIELVAALEDRYAIRVSDDNYEDLESVKDVISLVQELAAANAEGAVGQS
jgi:acyl carrier protein